MQIPLYDHEPFIWSMIQCYLNMYMTVLFTITQIHFDLKKKIIEVLSHIISTLYKNIPYPLFSKFLSYGI